ncbi:MAG: ADP-forming succinate--CoA ligase subunit beta [Bacteroidales bacterium]
MNLHEYQGKQLLRIYEVPVAMGILVENVKEAIPAAKQIEASTGVSAWAVKAQVHAGGRGKGGGVKIAKSLDEVEAHASDIIGMHLVTPQTSAEGKLVRKVLVEQGIYYPGDNEPEEFYMSLLLDRESSSNVIVYSPRGGINIEEVAEETPDQIFTEIIDPVVGIQPFQCRRIAFNLGLTGDAFKNMLKFIPKLVKAYLETDASLIEINPLFKTADNKILVVDTKMTIDDNSLFRHPDIIEMRDLLEEDPMEVEAGKHDLNYVKLDGNVGCMVNGAGLAMATMDIIKLSGGAPANFLDVGGSANAQRVEAAFRIILQDPGVEAILVNIFGGIVRCDRVARGIIDACENIGEIKIPIIVRLQGTNAGEAKKLIDDSGLEVQSAILLKDAASLVTKAIE